MTKITQRKFKHGAATAVGTMCGEDDAFFSRFPGRRAGRRHKKDADSRHGRTQREADMRVIACLLVALLPASPVAAQVWKTYPFPTYSFAVAFPADPKIETTSYQAADDRTVEAHVYSVMRGNSVLRMTVVELAGAPVEDTAAIEHAVAALTRGHEVKLDIPHHIGAVQGRQLSITHSDGSRSFAAVFYRKWRLYQIEGVALAGDRDALADAIRFQQSIEFGQSLDFASEALPLTER